MKCKGRNEHISLFPLDFKAERLGEMVIKTITLLVCLLLSFFGFFFLHQRETSSPKDNHQIINK